ncbi:MAG: hypothetical protein ABIZ70_09580 [Gemmatimonadales bacterium]
MSRRPFPTTTFLGAAVVGVLGGWLLAGGYDHRHRRNLFSPRRHRRFAALGWLERRQEPAALPLLLDYVAWEPVPVLQGRARRLISQLEAIA